MKDLEKIFSESLSNHEVPYDANAWTSLSKKMAVKAKPFYKKGWFYGAVAGAAILVSGSVLLMNNEDVKNDQVVVAINEDVSPRTNTNSDVEVVADNILNENHVVEPNSNEEVVFEDLDTKEKTKVKKSDFVQMDTKENEPKTDRQEVALPVLVDINAIVPVAVEKVELNAKFNLLATKVCEGGSIFIHLPSQETGVQEQILVNGKSFIPNAKDRNIELKNQKSGIVEVEYIVEHKNSKQKKSSNLKVDILEAELLTVNYTNRTENGIPLTSFSTDTKKAIWSIDGKVISDKSNFKHLFLKKGRYELKLTGQNQAGCQSESAEIIEINADYKLFAEEAMDVKSSDPRNSSFMPAALEQMDNPEFMLTVLDAKTGTQLFTSNDVNNKWDGSDAYGNKLPNGAIVYWSVIVKGNKYINGPISGDIVIQN